MKRLTRKTEDTFRPLADETELAQRLGRYEEVQLFLQRRRDAATRKLEELKAAGRTKTATYHQLLGERMMIQNHLDHLALYGLEQIEEDEVGE